MRSSSCLVLTLALLAPRVSVAQEAPSPAAATLPEVVPMVPAAPVAQPEPGAPASTAALLAGELEFGRRLIGFARPKADEVRAMFPFQNAYQPRALEGDAIYEALVRPDLVDKFRTRRIVRYTMPIAGGVVATAGMVTLMATTGGNFGRSQEEQMLIAGGVMMVLGAGALFGTMFIAADPINSDEGKQLVEEYNVGLRRRLGLPPIDVVRAAPPVSVAPMITRQGGGVSMALVF